MDNVKNDRYYLNRLIGDLEYIARHMGDISEAEFASDEILQDAMMFRLIQISENARRLSEPFRESFGGVPWGDVFGLRNRIVHDYGAVNLHIVYTTLAKDIPELIRLLSLQREG